MTNETETTTGDPGQLLYGFAARAMEIYAVADMLAQNIQSADEPGPACSMIASEAQKLNTELFDLAQRIKGMTGNGSAFEALGARAAHLVATCDGGQTFTAELQELADDVKALGSTGASQENGMSTTDGIAVNEIAAELNNLMGVCRCAANSDSTLDMTRSLYAVAHSLDNLNERLSEIGARMEREVPSGDGEA